MTNRISAYTTGQINPYRQLQQTGAVQQRPAVTATRPAAAAQATQASATSLSADEQRMIDRYFPDSATLSMRLYGPGQETHNVAPAALGQRLDLRG